MCFYKYIYCILHFLTAYNVNTIASNTNKDLIVRTAVSKLQPCAVGIEFVAEVNNTSEKNYDVTVTPDQCCLVSDHETDCDIVAIIGSCVDNVPTGTTKTFKLIAPLLDLFERKGYCLTYLDTKPSAEDIKFTRDTLRFDFDTTIANKDKVKKCSRIDEDPLNDCRPVDCESYYNDKRSHYSKNLKKCVNVPACVSSEDLEVPNVILDPVKNLCINEDSVTNNDISFVKSMNSRSVRPTKDILIIKNSKGNYSRTNDSDNIEGVTLENYIKPELDDKGKILNLIQNAGTTSQGKTLGFAFLKTLTSNKYILTVFGIVIIVQCCLICTMIYFLVRNCSCCNKKKVVRKFFNYRQDASVTTPLIGNSNNDTDTTDYQYLSESSNNINEKIKCYKACQKSSKDNVKMSMSDDILSKCLNRRDWLRKPSQSEAIVENPKMLNKELQIKRNMNTEIGCGIEKPPRIDKEIDALNLRIDKEAKVVGVNVNYENEMETRQRINDISTEKTNKFIEKAKIKHSFNRALQQEDSDDIRARSEKEIRCQTYNNYLDEKSNITGFKPTAREKRAAVCVERKKPKRSTVSLSTEKGAQASFTNDSIDDFLSERGVVYLAGENISKYSFTSHSGEANTSSVSQLTGKTSKNNIVRNVLDLLKKKSKQGSSSDPGASKTGNKNFDVNLIHMSRASVCSSSVADSDLKSLAGKSSRTSF